jgi:hypothetical protein
MTIRSRFSGAMSRLRVNVGLATVTAALLVACGGAQTSHADASQQAPDVGTLRSPAELGGDFQWRQQVTAEWPNGTRGFDAVLSKEGNTLLLIGLGPMDTPGFILRLNEEGLSVENHTGNPIPFDPKFILLDVQRAFYPWFDAPFATGERSTTTEGDIVTETWSNGTLRAAWTSFTPGGPPPIAPLGAWYCATAGSATP